MDRPWFRAAQKLKFHDPARFLADLRKIEVEVACSQTPERIRNLRTNGLKEAREQRQAALFCHGMGQRIGQTVFFAANEDQDYDFVASWVVEDKQHMAPVQLKEVVPPSLNPSASIDSIVAGLEKYSDSAGLTVAVHLNQAGRFESSSLQLQHLRVASFWIFAAASPDQSQWILWGNFTEPDAYGTRFIYPAEA